MEQVLHPRIVALQLAHLIDQITEWLVLPAIQPKAEVVCPRWLVLVDVIQEVHRLPWVAHASAVAPDEGRRLTGARAGGEVRRQRECGIEAGLPQLLGHDRHRWGAGRMLGERDDVESDALAAPLPHPLAVL